MRRTLRASSCAVLASLAFATGCPGGKPPPAAPPKKSGELDKLMRTRMNTSYSQLVFLVFHSEGEPNFAAITEESAKLSEAVDGVLKLQAPPVVQSEQAREVYVDYNNTLFRDNEKFVAAIAQKDVAGMTASLTKIGDTCSACHHFFRIEIKDPAE